MKKSLFLFFLLLAVMLPMTLLAVVHDGNMEVMCPQVKVEVKRLPDLNTPRAGHYTFCVNGEVVVVGGHTSGFVPTATAEYYSNGRWHLMQTVYEHDQGFYLPLKSGKVMIAGGHEQHLGIGQIFAVELYDPVSHTFEGFGCLDKKRCMAGSVELDSGRVIIAGNWYADDGIETFDGQNRLFSFVKNVFVGRVYPYVFRTAKDDAIVFGSRDIHGEPLGSIVVDCLSGGTFHADLFDEWRPMPLHWPFCSADCFIGDEAKGEYAYLFPVENTEGQLAIAQMSHIRSQLPSDNSHLTFNILTSIPQQSQWGEIHYFSHFVADRNAGRGYLTGYGDDGRLYALCIDYAHSTSASGAPLTLYYTEPQDSIGYSMPVLTADGDLMMVGGATDSNFVPCSSALLLRVGKSDEKSKMSNVSSTFDILWLICYIFLALLLLLGLFFLLRAHRRKNRIIPDDTSLPLSEENGGTGESDSELMQRIVKLMEQQQMYLNSDLKVSDVATALGTNSRYISDCIKNLQGCSFSRFVNTYRINHAKEMMRTHPDMKIATLCMESGFTYETSFFRTFKTITGMTPREWIAQVSSISGSPPQ